MLEDVGLIDVEVDEIGVYSPVDVASVAVMPVALPVNSLVVVFPLVTGPVVVSAEVVAFPLATGPVVVSAEVVTFPLVTGPAVVSAEVEIGASLVVGVPTSLVVANSVVDGLLGSVVTVA
jgi:glycine cleavage system pyridoxal-binding protein P